MLDIFLIVILLVSALVGWLRGVLREILALASWVIAGWIAFTFSLPVGGLLQSWISDPLLRQVCGGFVLFVGVILLLGLAGKLTALIVDKTGMRGADRSLGLVFGLVRGVVLIAGVALLFRAAGLDQQPWWQQSVLVGFLDQPADALEQLITLIVAEFTSAR